MFWDRVLDPSCLGLLLDHVRWNLHAGMVGVEASLLSLLIRCVCVCVRGCLRDVKVTGRAGHVPARGCQRPTARYAVAHDRN